MIPFKVQVNTIYVCSCMFEYVCLYCDLSESQCDYHEFNGELIKVPWSLKRVKEVIDEVSPSLSLSLSLCTSKLEVSVSVYFSSCPVV